MGKFDWFWKAMGSTTERNNKKSKAVVADAHGLIEELSLLDDASLASAVASTVRDAHVRDFSTFVLSDGCAAFSAETHERAIGDLSTVARTMTCSEAATLIAGA